MCENNNNNEDTGQYPIDIEKVQRLTYKINNFLNNELITENGNVMTELLTYDVIKEITKKNIENLIQSYTEEEFKLITELRNEIINNIDFSTTFKGEEE